MATASQHIRRITRLWQAPGGRRGLAFLLALAGLLLLGFYTVTDPLRLTDHALLHGADWLGAAVCHRITERSFSINGRQLPLCARCSGMYLGVFVTALVFWLGGRLRRADLPPLPILLLLVGFIGLMGLDGLNSYSHFFPNAPHLYEPRNWLRLLTGMGTGLAMGSFIFPALAQTLWRQPDPRPILAGFGDLLVLLLAAATAVLLLLSNQPTLLYVMAVASTAGLLLILGAINAVLGLVLLRRDGRAVRRRETAVPMLIGIGLAAAELAALAWLRVSLVGTLTGFPGL
ncbi:MAG: DUF2085 domain-containing protein [Anaerolineales bacterium]|nr:DUF2085 domain-containing protein [Anaerolineales bacterium]